MSFNLPPTTTVSGGGFTFPAAAAASTPLAGASTFSTVPSGTSDNANKSFGFNLPGATGQPSLGFGGNAGTTTTAAAAPIAGGFSFGGTPAAAPQTTSFSLGSTSLAANNPNLISSLGTSSLTAAPPAATTSSTLSLGASLGGNTTAGITFATATPSTGTGFSLPTAASQAPTITSSVNTGISLGLGNTNAPISSIAPNLGVGSGGGGFSFGSVGGTSTDSATKPTISASNPTLTLGQTTVASSLAPQTSLSTITNTTQSNSLQQTLNFCELEELINKWNLVLEEHEKSFIIQATHVNAWDKLLIENSDKIIVLNDSVTKVKSEQSALEQELEFITAQHSELEECIGSLQKELSKVPQVDVERSQIYSIAENLDTQLKQMSEDLKEVVEHLNEANKAQDPNDPIVQIGRILNAHMNSLQWIEQSTSMITTKLNDITQIHETLKRDNERSLRFVYYDQ